MTDKLAITSDLGSNLVEAAESKTKRKITIQVISQISGLMEARERCLAIAEENTKAAQKIEKQIQALRLQLRHSGNKILRP